MKQKLYPFSLTKHAHDVDFRYNRLFNEISDIECGLTEVSREKYYMMLDLKDAIESLILDGFSNTSDGKVCYLTGKQIGLAKECVAWASSIR